MCELCTPDTWTRTIYEVLLCLLRSIALFATQYRFVHYAASLSTKVRTLKDRSKGALGTLQHGGIPQEKASDITAAFEKTQEKASEENVGKENLSKQAH